MKKFLILSIASIASIVSMTSSVQAQDLLEWGYYEGDGSTLAATGQGVSEYNIAMWIAGNAALEGGTIEGLKVPITDSSVITSLEAWVCTKALSSIKMNYATKKEVDLSTLPAGFSKDKKDVYATVMFDTPVEIPANGCYVGYHFTCTTSTAAGKSPLLIDTGNTESSRTLYIAMPTSWSNYGATLGASGMKVLVSGISALPEVGAVFAEQSGAYTVAGEETEVEFTVKSSASTAVTSINYSIEVAGSEATTGSAKVSIASGYDQTGTIKIKFTAPDDAGLYEVKAYVTKVNGKTNTRASEVSVSSFKNLARRVDRNSLIEEFTGTTCMNCPRGIVGMEKLRDTFGDRFVGVAIHQYDYTNDPMALWYYRGHGMTAAPSATIDGKEKLDPYYGNTTYKRGICTDFKTYLDQPANVDITSLKAEWLNNKGSVKVTATIETLCDATFELAYVLIADGLSGTETAWAQKNYYSQLSPAGDDLDPWCKGGKYGSAYAYPVYNDVAIASSYNQYSKTDASLPALAVGEPVQNSFTMALPTQTPLRTKVNENLDKVYAIAIVFNEDGTVAQALKVKVGEEYSAIEAAPQQGAGSKEQVAGSKEQVAGIYDLTGRKVSMASIETMASMTPGLVIINGKKYLIK